MKHKYNQLNAGERLREKRLLLGFTQEQVAEKLGLSRKYYADIERGSCGMSVETLIALGAAMDLSLDYIIFGKIHNPAEELKHTDEVEAIMSLLDNVPENKRKYSMRMLQLQAASWDLDIKIEE
ncbi:MAG: helix-turn-helix transcriptional regulator [Lachnospiraceae bacterium]|nr:helix-turn-helix transcriptional regulator [Lachnospiraceae bacterium]